ncbi:TPA: hypothetical protein K8M77_000345 [Clostridium perfringens]|nr:hypothetical protein [Clostridium perfringens]
MKKILIFILVIILAIIICFAGLGLITFFLNNFLVAIGLNAVSIINISSLLLAILLIKWFLKTERKN